MALVWHHAAIVFSTPSQFVLRTPQSKPFTNKRSLRAEAVECDCLIPSKELNLPYQMITFINGSNRNRTDNKKTTPSITPSLLGTLTCHSPEHAQNDHPRPTSFPWLRESNTHGGRGCLEYVEKYSSGSPYRNTS